MNDTPRIRPSSPGARLMVAVVVLMLAGGLAVTSAALLREPAARAERVRTYDLTIQAADIDYGNGNVWHAWTFDGTVPGPTLRVKVGEVLRVHVRNELDLVHSFHTHLTNYDFEMDGSQANVVADRGAGGMIAPGGEYTYEFRPTTAGIYYYHCHSSDGGLMISQHILQGLYGAIIVENPDDPPIRHEVLFMAEIGHETEGDVPPFIMNGLGLPGGEATLEKVYHEGGFEAVQAQLGRTVPFFEAKVGEPILLHVINIGNLEHTLHIHSATHTSLGVLGGRPWPANVVPLPSGAADTILVTFSQPGLWLFHCHVVAHADGGMIGVFPVTEPEQT